MYCTRLLGRLASERRSLRRRGRATARVGLLARGRNRGVDVPEQLRDVRGFCPERIGKPGQRRDQLTASVRAEAEEPFVHWCLDERLVDTPI